MKEMDVIKIITKMAGRKKAPGLRMKDWEEKTKGRVLALLA